MLSQLGLGSIALQRLTGSQARDVLSACLDNGITVVESSPAYGDAVDKVAYGIRHRRDSFFLIGKSVRRKEQGFSSDIETQLQAWETDALDLVCLHGITEDEELEAVTTDGGALSALLNLKEKGTASAIGITTHSHRVADWAIESRLFDAITLAYNIIDFDYQALFRKDINHGMTTFVMKALAGGPLLNYYSATDCVRFALSVKPDCVLVGLASPDEVKQAAVAREKGPADGPFPLIKSPLYVCSFCAVRSCPYPLSSLIHTAIGLWERYTITPYNVQEFATIYERNAPNPILGLAELKGIDLEICPMGLPVREILEKVEATFRGVRQRSLMLD